METIQLIFDYDETMTEETSQNPMLEYNIDRIKKHYNNDKIHINNADDYWKMLNLEFPGDNCREITYLQNILNDIKNDILLKDDHKITIDDLQYFGSLVKLSPGIIDFMKSIKQKWNNTVNIEIYIISVGMLNLIKGSEISKYVDGIFASELIQKDCDYVNWIKNIITSFAKTEYIIKIAKGLTKSVNDKVLAKNYRSSYKNCIVIGDGLSDLSIFGYIRKKGGTTIGVYKQGCMKSYINAHHKIGLQTDVLVPRDYSINGQTYFIINQIISEIHSKQRCSFPHELIHMYIKGTIHHKDTEEFVENHFDKCNQCIPAIRTILVPPK
jgi:hypothetical protein